MDASTTNDWVSWLIENSTSVLVGSLWILGLIGHVLEKRRGPPVPVNGGGERTVLHCDGCNNMEGIEAQLAEVKSTLVNGFVSSTADVKAVHERIDSILLHSRGGGKQL